MRGRVVDCAGTSGRWVERRSAGWSLMTLDIVPFADAHLEEAARLLSARYAALRRVRPEFPGRYERPEAAAASIHAVRGPGARVWQGVAALRAGRLRGYLVASRALTHDTANLALFQPPRLALVPLAGYAVDAEEGAALVGQLYAAALPAWLAAGLHVQQVAVPVDDADMPAAWQALGFGMERLRGVRPCVAEVEEPRITKGVAIRTATEDDAATVWALIRANLRYHAGSPIFAPYLVEAEEESRRGYGGVLHDRGCPHWLAERGGHVLGVLTLVPMFDAPEMPAGAVQVNQAYVLPQARGLGIGRTLLETAARWAAEHDYRCLVVDWWPANPWGGRFWPGHGFRPLVAQVRRSVDARMAWR